MAKDYSDIGLNDRFQSVNSLPARRRRKVFMPITDFESQIDKGLITTSKMGGTVQVFPNQDTHFHSDVDNAASLKFIRDDDSEEGASMEVEAGDYTPKQLTIDPLGTADMDFKMSSTNKWKYIGISAKSMLLAGGTSSATDTIINLVSNNWYIEIGGTTMAKLYNNGNLHIRGSLVENDSTP